MRIDFGKHAGERYTRVPVSYLRWMVNVRHPKADIAEAELNRRGTTLPTLEISHHAIDRASVHLLDKWRKWRQKDEGLYSWLHRVANQAWQKDQSADRVEFGGIVFVFERDGAWPVVKTVIRSKRHAGT